MPIPHSPEPSTLTADNWICTRVLVLNASYEALDEVTADRAVQDSRNSRRARLENVDADMTLDKERWLNATAASGLFDADARTLVLDGFVHGEQRVTGQGPLGTMSADKFEVDKATQQIRLKGNVHTTFQKAAGKT